LVESEAKNPLPPNTKNNLIYTDVAGLSWVILDDPYNIEITFNSDKMRCN
jgi:hypothetical protein